jgi:Tol biopolymer transport system component
VKGTFLLLASISGGKIVYSSNRDGDYYHYIMNTDGTGEPHPLTNNPAKDILPDWQPIQ